MTALSTRELAELVGGELRGDGDRLIEDVAASNVAQGHHVTFLDGAAAD